MKFNLGSKNDDFKNDSKGNAAKSTGSKGGSDSHAPLVDRALMGLDLAAEHHLANCPCCQGEREKTERALERYAAFEREQVERQETFWADQATRIRAACNSVRRRPAAAAALVPALGLLLVLGLGLMLRRQPVPAPPVAHIRTVSDHELLLAVESAVDNGTPYALEPVALMVEEREPVKDLQKRNVRQKMNKEPKSYAK